MKILKVFAIMMLVLHISNSIAKADFTFGQPVKVPNVNSEFYDSGSHISADGLELYFHSDRPNDANLPGNNIWVSRRSTKDEPWSAPVMLDPPVNSIYSEASSCLSADGLELYFTDGWKSLTPRPGGNGGSDIWVSRRLSKEDPWGEPENLGSKVNSSAEDEQPSISTDGLSLYFMSDRTGGSGVTDIYVTTRRTKNEPWGSAENVGATINAHAESSPYISSDGLSLFFSRGGLAPDIVVAQRGSTTDPWGQEFNFNAVNSPGAEYYVSFSTEDMTLYFSRGDGLGIWDSFDLWQVEGIPIVDLNGDGVVDVKDIVFMIEHWGENFPLCDINQIPFGDGTVDVQDLLVLTSYISPEPIAHWALDEVEGSTAHDKINENNDVIMGNPIWLPTDGKVGGALELDGSSTSIFTDFKFNPATGPFSILIWIKGGAPGQVIVSLPFSADLLKADISTGNLTTELKDSEGFAKTLTSETVITDGLWHRIGLVWDGSHRQL